MWSNNDGMDPNWKPSEPDPFESAMNEWYNKFPGVPNTVHVRDFAHKLYREQQARISALEAALGVATEALKWMACEGDPKAVEFDAIRKIDHDVLAATFIGFAERARQALSQPALAQAAEKWKRMEGALRQFADPDSYCKNVRVVDGIRKGDTLTVNELVARAITALDAGEVKR